MYECRECNITFKQPVYHYTLSLRISDQTGSMWIRAFDKVGTTILGKGIIKLKNLNFCLVGYDANKIQQMRQMHDDAAINEIFREAANQEYNFRLFAKREDNNQNPGETRVTLQATRVEKINYAKDGQALVNLLEEFGNLKT